MLIDTIIIFIITTVASNIYLVIVASQHLAQSMGPGGVACKTPLVPWTQQVVLLP